LLGKWFKGPTLESSLAKARERLAVGDFDAAHRTVEEGLVRFPDSDALRDTGLTIRRAQARAGMQHLKDRIARERDPRAYEQLIQLYGEVNMPEEARREAIAYVAAHPDRDTPHLLLGEMHLQAFFRDLVAREAHAAHEHLVRAARLNPEALKPRLLLAEVYFCVGADKALHVVAQSLTRFAETDPAIAPVLQQIATLGPGEGQESVDGLFEKVEVRGGLVREATAWPIRNRRNREAEMNEERTSRAVAGIVHRGEAAEVVVLRRGGGLVSHSVEDKDGTVSSFDARSDEKEREKAPPGLIGVARTVARDVAPRAREFDLGDFKRCTVQGGFGTIVVGEIGGWVVGARSRGREPLRLWERMTVALEGEAGGTSS
jgi:hypothetical protein